MYTFTSQVCSSQQPRTNNNSNLQNLINNLQKYQNPHSFLIHVTSKSFYENKHYQKTRWNDWESIFDTPFSCNISTLSYLKFKKKNSQTSVETQQEQKIKTWNFFKNENTRFSLGFILILRYRFHQNNYFLLQQHWFQGLQIGLPSW
jgi:hypothetical protein